MSFILKQTNGKKGLYLQIYETIYNPSTKMSSNKCIETIGYASDLIASGITDPVSFYKEKIKKMNLEKKTQNIKLISSSPMKNFGYVFLKNIYNSLCPSNYLQHLYNKRQFQFNPDEVMQALIYSRVVDPESKLKTYSEVIPTLYSNYDFSLDQIYDAVEYFGANYDKIVETFNQCYLDKYKKRDTSNVYFDCTNFYFEIDREDDLRRKGPSKENRKEPIVGLGLLLDAEQIPIAMKVYPGSQSEKPVLREIITDMKKRYTIKGRTIQVADKGLNCARNIHKAISSVDGYIYSQSVKMLSDKEKNWLHSEDKFHVVTDLSGEIKYKYKECTDTYTYRYEENGEIIKFNTKQKRVLTFNPDLAKKQLAEINKLVEKAHLMTASQAKKSELGECSKYINIKAINEDGVVIDTNAILIDEEKIKEDKALAGYNLLITSETNMPATKIYQTYHNLWNIEKSFRIMKSQLDARPVFLQKQNSIYGHFLICYLSLFILRILQFKKFKNEINSEAIIKLIRDFRVVCEGNELNDKCINITNRTNITDYIQEKTGFPVNTYILSNKVLRKMLEFTF